LVAAHGERKSAPTKHTGREPVKAHQKSPKARSRETFHQFASECAHGPRNSWRTAVGECGISSSPRTTLRLNNRPLIFAGAFEETGQNRAHKRATVVVSPGDSPYGKAPETSTLVHENTTRRRTFTRFEPPRCACIYAGQRRPATSPEPRRSTMGPRADPPNIRKYHVFISPLGRRSTHSFMLAAGPTTPRALYLRRCYQRESPAIAIATPTHSSLDRLSHPRH